ncbi:hypothetical protein BDZ89DRAFT_514069 [Hymenopellis radicata]|nr:hypothetical protein BDZ89DRAFT_514069 [Hymenopellis radicata]
MESRLLERVKRVLYSLSASIDPRSQFHNIFYDLRNHSIGPILSLRRPDGKMRFCMKTYSENEGLLPQLIQLGVLQRAPGVAELQNGPLVDVLLDDWKVSHACLNCTRPGMTGAVFEYQDAPRLQCCSKCKTAYYCDAQCQKDDWKVHKKDCDLWRTNRPEAMRIMENTRRADMSAFLGLS